MRELAARRRQAELRELRAAELESRLVEAWQRQPQAPKAAGVGLGRFEDGFKLL